jgi:RHS repeat-associated protein
MTDPHNHYTFGGKEWEEHLGLYAFGYRLYDPQAGVWLTEDPLRGSVARPRTLHRYQYAFASPISYYDVYGLQGSGGGHGGYGEGPEGAQESECIAELPSWMNILSAPWRIFPYDVLGWGGEQYADWLVNEHFPNLSWKMRWLQQHPARAWGLPEDSLKTLMIDGWFFELGRNLRYFDTDDRATQILRHHEGVEEARKLFYQQGCQSIVDNPETEDWEGYLYDVGHETQGFERLGVEIRSHARVAYEIIFQVPDSEQTIAGTLGSYGVEATNLGDGVAEFSVYNVTSRESFLRIPSFSFPVPFSEERWTVSLRTPWGLGESVPREETKPTWFSERGWGGNLEQYSIWTEPIPPDICNPP